MSRSNEVGPVNEPIEGEFLGRDDPSERDRKSREWLEAHMAESLYQAMYPHPPRSKHEVQFRQVEKAVAILGLCTAGIILVATIIGMWLK